MWRPTLGDGVEEIGHTTCERRLPVHVEIGVCFDSAIRFDQQGRQGGDLSGAVGDVNNAVATVDLYALVGRIVATVNKEVRR